MRRLWAFVVLALLPNRALAVESPPLAHSSQLVLSVSEPRDVASRIGALARELGGQLVDSGGARVTVEVPTSKYAELRRRLAELGDVRSEQVSAQDLTLGVASAQASAEAARQSHERLGRLQAIARSVEEGLALERELEASKKALAEAEARSRQLARRGAAMRVVVRLEIPSIEPITKSNLPFPWLAELGLQRLLDTSNNQAPPSLELRALVDAELHVAGAHVVDEERLDGTSNTLALGSVTRVLGEANPIGLFGGFDLTLGGGGGFLYGAQALLGAGVPIGRRVAIGLSTGPGIDGITGTIPFGVRVPIELYVALDVADFMNASVWVRDGWVLAADARKDGAANAPFGDELSAGATLGFGSREDHGGYSQDRFGPRLGFAYREQMGTPIYELRLGWGAQSADYSTSY